MNIRFNKKLPHVIYYCPRLDIIFECKKFYGEKAHAKYWGAATAWLCYYIGEL